jgi:hypothetical protein
MLYSLDLNSSGPRSLPCSLVGFWRPKTADLLYKFSVQLPDLLYFGLTFGAKIPIFRCGGPKFSLLNHLHLLLAFSNDPRVLQPDSRSTESISPWPYEDALLKKKSRAPRDLLYSSRTLLYSTLFYSIKRPEIGPFWDVDVLYCRPSGRIVTGGLTAHSRLSECRHFRRGNLAVSLKHIVYNLKCAVPSKSMERLFTGNHQGL